MAGFLPFHQTFSAFTIMAALGGPALVPATAHAQGIELTFCDRSHRDYHRWNHDEDRYYREYLREHHRRYHSFSRMNHQRQLEYWRWRHEHERR
jgi:hypothetical protein